MKPLIKTNILFYRNTLLLLLLLLIASCTEQKEGNILTVKEKASPQEQKDWEELDNKKAVFCVTPEKCKQFDAKTFWGQRRYEDSLERSRLKMVENFLKKYPNSEHYFDVLKFYFNYLFEPRFIKDSLSSQRRVILDQHSTIANGDMTDYFHQARSIPFDIPARESWLKKGDSLVNRFLKTPASNDQKAALEVARLGRDLRLATSYQKFLYLNKKPEEREFWLLFDRYFWKDLVKQLDSLILNYPNYYKWPLLVDQFIATLTKENYSPELAETYWEHFYQLTNKPDMFQKHPVLQKLHTKAGNSLEALKKMESFDKTKPLEMQLVSMDGKKINLEDYRGKVVLLDFWSIRCAPCIQEMPHVRKMYDKYKDKGFEVIGIAAEDEAAKQRIVAITKRQGANWPQVLDKSSAASISYHTLYKISALPTVWLLDQEGRIVDKHARGARLEPLIKKYLDLEEEKQR